MLNKKDLKCLGGFIDVNNPKLELNYALVGRGGVWAIDSFKAIKFHLADLSCDDVLVHKKLLKGFESCMGKQSVALVSGDGYEGTISSDGVQLFLNTADFDYEYPLLNDVFNQKLDEHFVLDRLDDILFELSSRFCFIDSEHLAPLVAHGGGEKYDVFYTPMTKESMGLVKIVASVVRDDEVVVLYTAVIRGREFVNKAV